MGLFVGVAYVALRLIHEGALRLKAEWHYMLIAVLDFELRVVNAVPGDPRGSAGLKTAELHSELLEAVRKGLCRLACVRAGLIFSVADIDNTFEISAGADNYVVHLVKCAQVGHDPGYAPIAVAADFHYLRLLHVEVFLFFKGVLHEDMIKSPVLLVAEAVHRGPLAEVEHAALYHHFVRRLGHLAAEGVYLPHKVPL